MNRIIQILENPECRDVQSPYVNFETAKKFMGYSKNTLGRRIEKAKAGKSSFPYYQDGPNSPYKFIISELRLWRFNRTKGIVK